MWFAAASWLSKHVLHLLPTPSVAAPILLVDNINGYVELLCFVVLAALATIVWTFLDRKRPDYRKHEWLRVYVLWFAKTLSDSDFNRIQGCRPQAKCDSTLGWSTPFGYS
jgi:hypothetical protein